MKQIFLFLIRLYQLCLSPIFGSQCRFVPSCSAYAVDAINAHGPTKGTILAVKRILRCNPFSKGGYDPVIK